MPTSSAARFVKCTCYTRHPGASRWLWPVSSTIAPAREGGSIRDRMRHDVTVDRPHAEKHFEIRTQKALGRLRWAGGVYGFTLRSPQSLLEPASFEAAVPQGRFCCRP